MPETNEELPTTFVAIGPNAWGKAETFTEAVKNCKANVGRRGKITIRVMCVVGFNSVSDIDGSINYNKDGSCKFITDVTYNRRSGI